MISVVIVINYIITGCSRSFRSRLQRCGAFTCCAVRSASQPANATDNPPPANKFASGLAPDPQQIVRVWIDIS